ncbi:hypothetical protein JD969_16765 [Planctomycetota bacterium]|nr:hypothetical protein JD969_16765 [Planctomycetota bacterium]
MRSETLLECSPGEAQCLIHAPSIAALAIASRTRIDDAKDRVYSENEFFHLVSWTCELVKEGKLEPTFDSMFGHITEYCPTLTLKSKVYGFWNPTLENYIKKLAKSFEKKRRIEAKRNKRSKGSVKKEYDCDIEAAKGLVIGRLFFEGNDALQQCQVEAIDYIEANEVMILDALKSRLEIFASETYELTDLSDIFEKVSCREIGIDMKQEDGVSFTSYYFDTRWDDWNDWDEHMILIEMHKHRVLSDCFY